MKKRETIILLLVTLLAVAAALGVAYYKKGMASPKYPEIKFDNDTISVSINATDKELLKGVTATDPEDGDISDSLIVGDISNIVNGKYARITYAACDSQNHVTKAQRTVVYTDYTSPRFSMTGPMIFKISNNVNILQYINAEDVFEGDISRNIKFSITTNGVDFGEVGEYEVVFSVTNSKGDTSSLPITVEVTDRAFNSAEITLSDYLVYLKPGDEFDAKQYVVGYQANGSTVNGTKGLKIDGDVDTDTPGVYKVEYTYKGNTLSQTSLYVVVG